MAPPQIVELIERFRDNETAYRSGQYNETQVRQEFINPLFESLGWDMHNRQGYAEAYKDVIHEAAIRVGGATKAPDYCFRVGGRRIFFLEAKKPAINVRDDVSPAFQLRRYAWSAKLALSVLTDFEELAVYDCRIKPDKNDKASVGRILYVKYTDYVERWDEIAAIFSREAVLRGSFDRFAESTRLKRGTAEVDVAFLNDIESWREELARNFALRNPEIQSREMNFAVERTIDRTIFLRMCEDRAVEEYGQLQALLNGEATYKRLCELFDRADERYNSGLFHFQPEPDRNEPPDELTQRLKLDDRPLKEIIGSLYYPDSPYEFSVLPAEILGQVYEQFLGKVIRLTAGHRAVVEDKPEVKKAGGVYYTPAYIVDYIVKHTVGKLIEGKSPKQVSKLRVVDPACGSGSFLLGAYTFLLDWHRDWYVNAGTAKHAKEIYHGAGGQWRLTTAEKKRILLNNIYGVDIDAQAVEVTKLSLLLKVLEGENRETLERQRRLLHERALPDLGGNIKCGNSLIGPDFYNGHQLSLFDEDERYRINAFDWKAEFAEVFRGKDGGFDAVIGNPPYVRMETFKDLKSYLRQHYKSHAERCDMYVYFLEREHDLLRAGGTVGIIVSNKFLRAKYGEKIRHIISTSARVDRIIDLAGLPVFRGATVRTIVLVTTKEGNPGPVIYAPPMSLEEFKGVESGGKTLDEASESVAQEMSGKRLAAGDWSLNRSDHDALVAKLLASGKSLFDVVGGKVCRGIVSGLTEAFVITSEQRKRIVARNAAAKAIIQPFLQGRNIRRFSVTSQNAFLIYTHHGVDMRRYPAVLDHLKPFKKRLERRATTQEWYELQQPQFAYKKLLEGPKIVFPDIATTCRFARDDSGLFGANTVYFIPSDDARLLAILNSRVAFFFFIRTCAALEGTGAAYLRFFGQYLEKFPIPPEDRLPKRRREKLVELVDLIEDLHKRLDKSRTPHDKTQLQRQIEATDRQIDQLVYELYELTDEEIRIVEEATQARG